MNTNTSFSAAAKGLHRRPEASPGVMPAGALRAPKARLAMLTLLGALCACGGGAVEDKEVGRAESSGVVRALMDDEGHPMPNDPETMPTDPALHNPALRYASAAQAQQLEEAMGAQWVFLELHEGSPSALASALNLVQRVQAEQAATTTLPVLVRAGHLQHASELALRLGERGFARVWVVTQ